MKRILIVALSVLLGACSGGIAVEYRVRQQPWDGKALDAVGALPVQDGGRVKPWATYAQFALLSINGNREYSLNWSDGARESLSATAWLLDCLFYPEQARHYRCLRIDNDEAVEALGLHIAGRKRLDRYSYEELRPAQGRLMELGSAYHRIDAKKRTAVQQQIWTLANQVVLLDRLLACFDFARARIDVQRTDGMKAAFPGESRRLASWVLQNLPTLMTMEQMVSGNGQAIAEMDPERRETERKAVAGVLAEFGDAIRVANTLTFLPPVDPAERQWSGVQDVVDGVIRGQPAAAAHLQAIQQVEAMAASRAEPARFAAAAQGLLATVRGAAEQRGEYAKIGTEVAFYRGDFFYRALLVFGLGFVLAAFSWARPQGRWLVRAAFGAVGAGTLLVIAGIVLRCIIRSRPPVSTLYETILFIAAVTALVGLVIEWIDRRRIGLTLTAFFGMGGMFLARKFEELEGTDTMPQLVAVLDTNFWLSTHVTTVTMGYAAGLLASVLATVYIFGKLLRIAGPTMLGRLARIVYGVICFGLLFSLVGTILGGIWANDSWGRFWGWDPKENGALLICLVEIAILHARMAGWLKQHGLAMAAVANGVVVAFSWWHVNLLGVGLHSYGFTGGILTALLWFYGTQLLILALGVVAWYQKPAPETAEAGAALPQAAPADA